MDNISNTLTRLETIKQTHPNIYHLWREYINKKMDNLNSIINTCNNTMDMININNQEDLDVDTIISLFLLVDFFNNENR